MIMRRIKLCNYRCFEELDLDLAPRINLLIGDNASGKTSILYAIRTALSAFFLGYSDENTCFLGLSKRDFRIVESDTSLQNERPVSVSFEVDAYENSIDAELALLSSKGRTRITGAKKYKEYSRSIFNSLFDKEKNIQVKALPLFAYFSTEDIHSNSRQVRNRLLSYKHKPSLGYYECLEGNGLFNIWQKRMLILAEKDSTHPELVSVIETVKYALGQDGCNIIRDIAVRPQKGEIYYCLSDGREVEANMLSDGYRRIIHIVTEIAFRCLLLNRGVFGDKSCTETRGTVLIDEIDWHLHPTLQSCIVGVLSRAFPNIQFIVTTHAPMVMGSVKQEDNNRIYKMSYKPDSGYRQTMHAIYGMDASTIIETILEHDSRNSEVKRMLDDLFEQIDRDEYQKANESLKTLKDQFEDTLPELAKAETMLYFLNNEEDN